MIEFDISAEESDFADEICEWSLVRAKHGATSIQHEGGKVVLRYRDSRLLPERFPIIVDDRTGTICEPVFIFMHDEYSGVGAQSCVENTNDAYGHDLKSWFVYLEEFGIAWTDATSSTLDSYLEFLKGAISPQTGKGYSAVTINRRRMIIGKMYEFWRKQKYPSDVEDSLLRVPSTARKAKGKAKRPIQVLTPVQQQTLLNALGIEPSRWSKESYEASSRSRLYGDIALISGLRIAEIWSLKTSHFSAFLSQSVQETELYFVDVLRKGGEVKQVAFPGELILEILTYMQGERQHIVDTVGKDNAGSALILHGVSVSGCTGMKPSIRTIERDFAAACLKVGLHRVEEYESLSWSGDGTASKEQGFRDVPSYVFHDLRHTFAITTYYALKHAGSAEPWLELADRLGHADPRTTIRTYLRGTKTFEGRVTDRVMGALRGF